MAQHAKGASVAFIGLGVMGAPMAGHLMDAGCHLTVHTRTPERSVDLLERGAVWAASPGEAAAAGDVVFTMVGYPADVEEIYLGPEGIIASARDGALLIDTTTSTPALAIRIAAAAEEQDRGLTALDAPVSGGDIGAREARLTIMCGGTEAAFERARPLLDILGRTVNHMGGPGAGQHTKMANQIKIAGVMLGMIESLAYARAAGLDLERVHATLAGGSANSWSWENYVPRILRGDMAPGFFVKHFIKDLRIALDEAGKMGVDLPGLTLAQQLYTRLAEEISSEGASASELGTQALWLLYVQENTLGGSNE